MGDHQRTAPINEGVFLLGKLSPTELTTLREQYPQLSEELKGGIYAGTDEDAKALRSHIIAKANILIAALQQVVKRADSAMATIAQGIRKARFRRLLSQIVVLLGSSSLLGALALNGKIAEVISAVLTLLAALGNLLAENYEKLLNPQAGNIYQAFQKLGEGVYQARSLSAELELAVRYNADDSILNNLVGEANKLCEQLNGWLIQVLAQYSSESQNVNRAS